MADCKSLFRLLSRRRKLTSDICTGIARGSQDRFGCPPVNLKVRDELVRRHAIRQPVEELLYGQTAAPETRRPAHAARIDPYRLVDSHRSLLHQQAYPRPSDIGYSPNARRHANATRPRRRYPLTDPAISPRTKYRCSEKKTTNGITMVTNAPEVSTCQSCPREPTSSAKRVVTSA